MRVAVELSVKPTPGGSGGRSDRNTPFHDDSFASVVVELLLLGACSVELLGLGVMSVSASEAWGGVVDWENVVKATVWVTLLESKKLICVSECSLLV